MALTRVLDLELQVNLAFLLRQKQALRDELEQTQWRLEKLDRTKSDFISIAAHELENASHADQGLYRPTGL